ncbi:hypothetical protein RYX36_009816 [Vicia faba]
MSFELYGMLAGNVSPLTGEPLKPAYGGDNEAFKMKLIRPIYDTIHKAMVMIAWKDSGNLSNIFDGEVFKKVLNIFIIATILKLAQAGNVSPLTGEPVKPAYGGDNEAFMMKVIRPIYDTIHKAMVMIAWKDSGNLSNIFDGEVFKKVLNIFIIATILKLAQVIVSLITE